MNDLVCIVCMEMLAVMDTSSNTKRCQAFHDHVASIHRGSEVLLSMAVMLTNATSMLEAIEAVFHG